MAKSKLQSSLPSSWFSFENLLVFLSSLCDSRWCKIYSRNSVLSLRRSIEVLWQHRSLTLEIEREKNDDVGMLRIRHFREECDLGEREKWFLVLKCQNHLASVQIFGIFTFFEKKCLSLESVLYLGFFKWGSLITKVNFYEFSVKFYRKVIIWSKFHSALMYLNFD